MYLNHNIITYKKGDLYVHLVLNTRKWPYLNDVYL